MSKRFKLEPSSEKEGWWVLTDTENLVVIRFEQHKFNETQQVTLLNEADFMSLPGSPATRIATVMREMGDWIARHHYSTAMPVSTHEWREDEDTGDMLLIRNKKPRLIIKIEEQEVGMQDLADALRKAAEFVLKGGRIK